MFHRIRSLVRPVSVSSRMSAAVSTLVLMVVAGPALADFSVPDGNNFGWTRGVTANSTYAQWESFTSPAGPNVPDAGQFIGGALPGSAPAWNVFDTSGGSFVTGGGNIYAPAAATSISVIVPGFDLGGSYTTTVLLQVRTQGTEPLASSFSIGGVQPVQTQELLRQPLGGFGGFLVDALYRFELPGNANGYTLRFDAAASSMSLDRVAVDTFASVPTPGVPALLGIGGLAASRRRRH